MQRLGNVLEMSSLISSRLASLSAAENPASVKRWRVTDSLSSSVGELLGLTFYKHETRRKFFGSTLVQLNPTDSVVSQLRQSPPAEWAAGVGLLTLGSKHHMDQPRPEYYWIIF
jgi:hypothetical protein